MWHVIVCQSSVGRTLEEFKTSVTVAAFGKVTFELTYEELLQRQHGRYQLLINAQPMQPVADFKVKTQNRPNGDQAFCAALKEDTVCNTGQWMKIFVLFSFNTNYFWSYVSVRLTCTSMRVQVNTNELANAVTTTRSGKEVRMACT